MNNNDEKSFFNPNKELAEALKGLSELVAENTRHLAAQSRWFRDNLGAVTKCDLEKAKDELLEAIGGQSDHGLKTALARLKASANRLEALALKTVNKQTKET